MNAPTLDQLAARALREEPIGSDAPLPLDRARQVGALEQAIRQRGRQGGSRLTASLGAGALAALLVAGFFSYRAAHRPKAPPSVERGTVAQDIEGAPWLVQDDLRASVVEGMVIPQGATVITAEASRMVLQFTTGSRLEVGAASELELTEVGASHQVRLTRGSVHASVRKLAPNRRFRVLTQDAEIEVRGTSFLVSKLVEPCAGKLTRVTVNEGVVVVRSQGKEDRVLAGQSWPESCFPSGASSAPRAVVSPVAVRREPRPGPRVAAPEVLTRSSLFEQNDLFSRAMAAQRAGQREAAIDLLGELLTRFPQGPLTEPAEAAQMRAWSALDRARASQVAREYLERHPQGFARSEALELLR